ncbi:hypothetical protein BDV12DRAFT_159952 [Aspergillus spectabilis]
MTRCLCSARLLCLHRRSSLRLPLDPVRSPSPVFSRSVKKLQWSRQYSAGVKHPIFNRELFRDSVRLKPENRFGIKPEDRFVPRGKEKESDAWISSLSQFLKHEGSKDDATHSPSEVSPEMTRETFIQSVNLAHHLYRARYELQMDPVAHLGFISDNWADAYGLLNKLLDGAEALRDFSRPQRGAIEDLALGARSSLDQLTDQDIPSRPQLSRGPRAIELANLDSLTAKPFLKEYHTLLMAEVWKILGAIIFEAADASPTESKQAMSCVYRILARLHHSGLVSERVYKYIPPESHQTTFRPPGMHLLSTHIMDVLSDMAWQAHEAQVAAEAAAAGRDPPYLPVKMGIKELGHEIWLEFILWSCLEHGHIKEGIWIINQLKERGSWQFQSWKPLLEDPELLRNTKIDREVSWRRSDSANITPEPRKSTDPPLPFHGLGERTISVEVVTALLDNITNLVYTGKSFGGVRPHALLRHIHNLKFAIAPTTSDAGLLPAIKATNWLTIRVIEAGGLVPEADPRIFDTYLRITPYIVPPWDSDGPLDEEFITQLSPSQLYNDTSAFAGLFEYNMKYYSYQRLCQGAMESFAMLYTMTDRARKRYLDKCFSSRGAEIEDLSSNDVNSTRSSALSASSNPHLSNVTLAHLLDLITVSRAFAFGEWLLYSDDADGPTVPESAYGDQALAPSLWRFAAATKNEALGESVIASLSPPISLNTFRALLNYRIRTYQWDSVISTLRYIRDNRVKSWSHSNIAAIAAELIRLDHTLQQQKDYDPTSVTVSELETNISEAKQVLYRLMVGEFDESRWRKARNPHFQLHTIIGFTRLFRHISCPSLREIVEMVFESKWIPRQGLPYIPSTSFHPILAAVVETNGSLAGERLYRRFCVTAESPGLKHLTAGGISRFDERAELDYRKGDPQFDAEYFQHLQKKMVFPNPNTVRIIAQGAVGEYEAVTATTGAQTQPDADNAAQEFYSVPFSPESEPAPVSLPDAAHFDATERFELRKALRRTIAFCIDRFEFFGMTSGEVVREVGQELYTNYRETEKIIRQKKSKTQQALLRGEDLGKTADFRFKRWSEKQEQKKERRRWLRL